MSAQSTPPAVRPGAVLALMLLSVAMGLLAAWEWWELVVLARGGPVTCNLNDTVNCGTVWTSTFATRLHAWTGLPVAGLGVVHAVAALGVAGLLWRRTRTGGEPVRAVTAVRVVAAVGVLACITFFTATVALKAVCLMCLGTYALTLGYAAVAVFMLPGPLAPDTAHLPRAVGEAALFAAGAWVLLLYPGLQTKALKAPGARMAAGPGELGDFLGGLKDMERRALADELRAWSERPIPPEAVMFGPREVEGAADAPVRITEFTDVLCGHCRALNDTLEAVVKAVPPGRLRIEPHQFPLDGECNRAIPRSDGTGVRCAAARALVCVEGTGKYSQLATKLFEEQAGLTKARVLELAAEVGPLRAPQLEACMASPETQAKIDADVQHALAYGIQGTPLVLVNGREASSAPAVLYLLAVSSGKPTTDGALQALFRP
ncbi:MAG: hypothetical protein RL653_2353 [Pseudomonadota bacterium]|jgi:protein-disulfide isomerase/uncharacterized membrane protein